MKTRNSNLQNNRNLAGITFMTAVFILLVTGTTVTAKEKVKLPTYNSLNAVELSIIDKEEENTIDEWMYNNILFAPATIIAVETDQEANLELGNWMLDASYFSCNFNFEVEKEEELALSDWMTNESLFSLATTLNTDQEEELSLENWMTDSSTFTKAFVPENEADKELVIEEWMMNDDNFTNFISLERDSEKKESVEAWMLNKNLFLAQYTYNLLVDHNEPTLSIEN